MVHLVAANDGDALASFFAVDVYVAFLEREDEERGLPGLSYQGTRRATINAREEETLRRFRYFWDTTRHPLFRGIRETITTEPIELPQISRQLIVVEVMSPSNAPTVKAYQVKEGSLAELTRGQFEFIADSERPAFRR